MNFQDYFSLENFQNVRQAYEDDEASDKTSPKTFFEESKIFQKAIVSFLQEMNEVKGLSEINYGIGHKNDMQDLWDKLINKDEMSEQNTLFMGRAFLMILFYNFTKGAKLEDSYNSLLKNINEGNISYLHLNHSQRCTCCNQSLYLEFKNWTPEFVAYNPKLQDFTKPTASKRKPSKKMK